jgi:hypothetical protein
VSFPIYYQNQIIKNKFINYEKRKRLGQLQTIKEG